MAQPRFDPSQAVKFDLNRGAVSLEGGDARLIVLADALLDLCKHADDDAVRDFGRRIGTEAGRRAAGRLVDGVEGATVAAVVEHLGGDLALIGLGSLSVERWGRALVFVVNHPPSGEAGAALVGAVLEGAVQRAMARDIAAVELTRDAESVRFLAASPATAEKVRGWLAGGTSWGDVLTKLDAGGDA